MSTTRVIYQSIALFAGPSPATGAQTGATNPIKQMHRMQTINHGWSQERQDINQMGQLAAIDRMINQPPAVTLDFSYYSTNANNESGLGFTVDGTVSAISGILSKVVDDRNYYILQVPQGQDANGYAGAQGTNRVIGIGNGFITRYQTEARVGGFAVSSVTVEGFNWDTYTGSTSQRSPAIDPQNGQLITGANSIFSLPAAVSGAAGQAPAIRAGEITLTLTPASAPTGLGPVFDDLKIQSYNLSFDLSREPQEKLGSLYPFSREIRFPARATVTIEANIGDWQSGGLETLLCNDKDYDIAITLRKPSCTGNGPVAMIYSLQGAKFDREQFANSIGPNSSATLEFSTTIGGPQTVDVGVFISGITE